MHFETQIMTLLLHLYNYYSYYFFPVVLALFLYLLDVFIHHSKLLSQPELPKFHHP